MKLRKYSEAQLREAIADSASMRQALQKLNVAPYGGNYEILRKAIRYFQLDTSHFMGKAWHKGKQLPAKSPLGNYLSNRTPIQSYKLKNRLLREGVFRPACSRCHNTHWLDRPVPLELDHINGNRRLCNLRLLCPNCHALTPNYRSKNRFRA